MRRRTSRIVLPLAGVTMAIAAFLVGRHSERGGPSWKHRNPPVLVLEQGHVDVISASAHRVICTKWSDDSECVKFDVVLRPHAIGTLTILCTLLDRQGQSLNFHPVIDKQSRPDGTTRFTYELDAIDQKSPFEKLDLSTVSAQIEVWGDFERLQVFELPIQEP